MKGTWLRCIVIAILAPAAAVAQQAGNSSPNDAGPERGTVAGNTYTNEFLGISFPIPTGWQVISDKAVALEAGGLRGWVLFTIERTDGVLYRNRIAASAVDSSTLTATPQHYVSVFVNAEKSKQVDWELLRDVFPVDLAGKHFFREDYKESSAGRTLHRAFVCTKFRGYFLGWTLAAGSPSELEESVNLLQRIRFRDEHALSDNIPGDQPTGIVGGILGPSPQSQSGPPLRVRVSQRVSEALLIARVQPKYPQDARKAGIQGIVVLQSLIDTNGNVKESKIIKGDPSLTSAALDAVKQWKYKPYLLNGQPVEVDTLVSVDFQLSMR